MSLDPALQWALRGALALALAVAALEKWRHPGRFREAVAGYRLLPPALVPAAAAGLALAESGLAVALVVPGFATPAAWAAFALIAVYTTAIALNLARGRRHIDCGCGGPAGRRSLSWALVARNGWLLGAAWLCALPEGARALTWIDAWTAAAGALGLACVHAACDALFGASPPAREEASWSTH